MFVCECYLCSVKLIPQPSFCPSSIETLTLYCPSAVRLSSTTEGTVATRYESDRPVYSLEWCLEIMFVYDYGGNIVGVYDFL